MAYTGSAPLPMKIVSWYRCLGLELLDVYGMTENLAYSHCSQPGQVRLGYSGAALPGVQCAIGDSGEILIKSPTQMMGYYKQPDLTADSMTADGFFRPATAVSSTKRAVLKITGRVKELFKTSKGKYVAPRRSKPLSRPAISRKPCASRAPVMAQPFALVDAAQRHSQGLQAAEQRDVLHADINDYMAR